MPLPIWTVSVDVGIDPDLCDLADPDRVAYWLEAARSGRVAFVLGGPPCETWSVARWNEGARTGVDGPRAMRSRQMLWGLGDLTAAEYSQVTLGNALLRTMLLFVAAARVYDFATVMEHPQEPFHAPLAPSVWRLPETSELCKDALVERVHVDQCTLGAAWKKPTCLLASGFPELAGLVRRLPGGGRCHPGLGHTHQVLRGRATDGSYRTAPAKTYGDALCRLLAQAAMAAAERLLRPHVGVRPSERPLPDEMLGLYMHLDRYTPPDPPDHWAHDCARAMVAGGGRARQRLARSLVRGLAEAHSG